MNIKQACHVLNFERKAIKKLIDRDHLLTAHQTGINRIEIDDESVLALKARLDSAPFFLWHKKPGKLFIAPSSPTTLPSGAKVFWSQAHQVQKTYYVAWLVPVQCLCERICEYEVTAILHGVTGLCPKCGRQRTLKVGKDSPSYKGGAIRADGYRVQCLSTYTTEEQKILKPMAFAHGTRILEHRAAMALCLDRSLQTREHVHHKNGDKLDNRSENLELVTLKNHNSRSAHYYHLYREALAEIKRLRSILKEHNLES